ncbi:MAG: STAS domain-containing protein, partial [Methyloprofundus sp.]|nr:STAS domain-containing protein [Methyloprofundus sp.]
MAISDGLKIEKISDTDNTYHFECIGSIDVNSKEALKIFEGIPAKAHVILEFKKVERVNSMGLSLLLKNFEEWEKSQTTLEIKDLNRMVNMLFKITGLGRFIKGNEAEKGSSDKKIISPQAPRHAHVKKPDLAGGITSGLKSKLNFVASLQMG